MAQLSRNKARKVKHKRLRATQKLYGNAIKPRLNIFKSHQNLYAQLIDDDANKTIAKVTTLEFKEYSGNITAASKLGELMGDKINALGIKEVIFDRGGYLYHGRVKAFADAVRSKGVKF